MKEVGSCRVDQSQKKSAPTNLLFAVYQAGFMEVGYGDANQGANGITGYDVGPEMFASLVAHYTG